MGGTLDCPVGLGACLLPGSGVNSMEESSDGMEPSRIFKIASVRNKSARNCVSWRQILRTSIV
jgi:hypothetical protein